MSKFLIFIFCDIIFLKLNSVNFMKIFIGADHRGFKLKQAIKNFLIKKDFLVDDIGAFEFNKNDDYVDFAKEVAQNVSKSKGRSLGILICGSGIGVCMTANKIPGVRAGVVWKTELARVAKEHDNVNVLCLPADFISARKAKVLVQTWLDAKFKNKNRYIRRLRKLRHLEK